MWSVQVPHVSSYCHYYFHPMNWKSSHSGNSYEVLCFMLTFAVDEIKWNIFSIRSVNLWVSLCLLNQQLLRETPTLLRFLHALPAFLQSPRYFISSVMADLEVSWPEKSKSRISTIFFSNRNLLSRANVTKDLVYVRRVGSLLLPNMWQARWKVYNLTVGQSALSLHCREL